MTHISGLTRVSEEALAKAMSLWDLRFMALLKDAVRAGKESIMNYRTEEMDMIKKYGFKVRKMSKHSRRVAS